MEIANDPVNALTVDVEDYYQVESFADVVRREDWGRWESRIERNTFKLLEMFAGHNVRGAFFILGWIAERYPHLAREILNAGHEIACHSYCLIRSFGGGCAASTGSRANRRFSWFMPGKSTLTSLYCPGRGWGMAETALPYNHFLVRADRAPEPNPMNPKFNLLIETWKRLSLSFTKLIGPMIVKYLP